MTTKFNKNQLPKSAVLEAPLDGKSYVRNDGQWIEATGGGGSGSEIDPIYTADKPKIVNYTADGSVQVKDDGSFGSINKELVFKSSERPIVVYPGEDVLSEWKLEIINNQQLPWENNAEFTDPSPKGWRVPTVDEWNLLISHPFSWTTKNGVNGLVVENCFFPAAGQRKYTGTLFAQGSYGWYWTKDAYSASDRHSNAISFNSTGFRPMNADPNVAGQSVRCVRDMSVLVTDPLFVPCPSGSTTVSGVTWANCNVDTKGVFVANDYDYGHYFQWGQAASISTTDVEVPSVNQIAYLEDIETTLIKRITTELIIPSSVKFIAEQHLPEKDETVSYVTLRAFDTSGITSDLTITCNIGFGSKNDLLIPGSTALDDGKGGYTVQDYVIKITKEDGATKSTIFIPKECNIVDIFWFI